MAGIPHWPLSPMPCKPISHLPLHSSVYTLHSSNSSCTVTSAESTVRGMRQDPASGTRNYNMGHRGKIYGGKGFPNLIE